MVSFPIYSTFFHNKKPVEENESRGVHLLLETVLFCDFNVFKSGSMWDYVFEGQNVRIERTAFSRK